MLFNPYTNLLCLLVFFSCFASFLISSIALDFITSSQFIKDPDTLSTRDSTFTLGFFSPENSSNRYVGIWYMSESTIIWVANRNQPLEDSSGVVTISENGNLVVMNGHKQTLWSTNVSIITPNTVAQLSDDGNLVLIDNTTRQTLWESFQHPSDSFVPMMKLSINPKTGEKAELTSWISPSNPSTGTFSASLEHQDTPEVFVYNMSRPYWRSGPWNGRAFLGVSVTSYLDGMDLRRERDGITSISFSLMDKLKFGVFKLNWQGKWVVTGWLNKKKYGPWMLQLSECAVYGHCGAFGSCNRQSSPICSCLSGFEPRNSDEWNRKNWTSGCVRKATLQCERLKNGGEAGEGDGFLKLPAVKAPDFVERSDVEEDKCRTKCLENCSCVAYAYDAGIRCMSWSGNLIDVEKFSSGGVDLFIRVANSELDTTATGNDADTNFRKKKSMTLVIAIAVTLATMIVAASAYLCWKWASKRAVQRVPKGTFYQRGESESIMGELNGGKLDELPLFDFTIIANATNNFHSANKLGRGGFGPVYKGELEDGQQIAVKRLSRTSGQGLEEFMNEVLVISKLQHRNLVRLLGCCVERDEKMLVYEYMPNGSLDAILFDSHKVKILDWGSRFNIIEGIARGVLYLHRDSRLKIIHRDLKTSNILLDEELNPKISDFGMAKIFQGGENEANTRRIVGTYGYISPEYAMEGLFSEKSDVFSFGVLLLEIISGRKNGSLLPDESLSLLGFAWKLWNEDNVTYFIDPKISGAEFEEDILRCIHIGLLCVQELARDRPTMATVISMLNSEIVNLPPPTEPAFVKRQSRLSVESSQKSDGLCSVNTVTVTCIQGR